MANKFEYLENCQCPKCQEKKKDFLAQWAGEQAARMEAERRERVEKARMTAPRVFVLDSRAVDRTRGRDGSPVVVYRNIQGQTFVMDRAEFFEKYRDIGGDFNG